MNRKQQLLEDMLQQVADMENDFPVIEKNIRFPDLSKAGIVQGWREKEDTKGYRGLALEVNDHGNVTVWNCFKNGNRREIVSRV